MLNQLQSTSQQPSHPSSPIKHAHLRLVDSFYTTDNSHDKIRVTREEKTGIVQEVTKKIRLGDLNIYCPKRFADWRVSVNLEVPGMRVYVLFGWRTESVLFVASHPIGSPSYSRRKDRMCYLHEEFKIDLTQVVTTTVPNAPVRHQTILVLARLIVGVTFRPRCLMN